MAPKNRTWPVYPDEWAGELLGGAGRGNYRLAIECWAASLARATRANESLLDPAEWNYLAAAFDVALKVSPLEERPGKRLADAARGAQDLDGAGNTFFGGHNEAKRRVGELAAKLHQLDYHRAWAVLWAVRWKQSQGDIAEGGRWWTQDYRTAKSPAKEWNVKRPKGSQSPTATPASAE